MDGKMLVISTGDQYTNDRSFYTQKISYTTEKNVMQALQ